MMQTIWTPEYQRFMERLKYEIVVGPKLARLDPYRVFDIKMDCSKVRMRAVILQADDPVEEINSETQEKDGRKC